MLACFYLKKKEKKTIVRKEISKVALKGKREVCTTYVNLPLGNKYTYP